MVRSLVNAGIVVLACGWSALLGSAQPAAGASLSIEPKASVSSPGTKVESDLILTSQEITWSNLNVSNISVAPDTGTPVPVVVSPSSVFTISPSTPSQTPVALPSPEEDPTFEGSKRALILNRKGSSVFHGLIEGTPNGRSGYVRFVLNRAGRGSASITLDGNSDRIVIPIQVDEDGNVTPSGNTSSEAVSISGAIMTYSDGSVGFDTVITNQGQRYSARVLQAEPSQDVSSAAQGKYTLVLENNTVGNLLDRGMVGYGVLQIKKSGAVTLSGRFSDGSTFSQGTQLNSSGTWTLYADAAGGAILSGTVSFADLSISDCSGMLQWQRPAGTETGSHQSVPLSLRGSRFSASDAFGTATQWNFKALADSGATQASGTLTPVPRNTRLKSTGADQTELKLNRTDGTLTGSLISPENFERHSLTGVFLQKTNEGFGLTKQASAKTPGGRFTLKLPVTSPGLLLTSDSRLKSANSASTLSSSYSSSSFSTAPYSPTAPQAPLPSATPTPESSRAALNNSSLRIAGDGPVDTPSPDFSSESPSSESFAEIVPTAPSTPALPEAAQSGASIDQSVASPSPTLPPSDISLPIISESAGLPESDTFAAGTIESPVVIPIPKGTTLSAASIAYLPPSRLFRLGQERKHYTVAELNTLFTEARFQGATTLVLSGVTFTL